MHFVSEKYGITHCIARIYKWMSPKDEKACSLVEQMMSQSITELSIIAQVDLIRRDLAEIKEKKGITNNEVKRELKGRIIGQLGGEINRLPSLKQITNLYHIPDK